MLPEHILDQLPSVKAVSPVSGGCIGENYKVITNSGTFFLKMGVTSEMICSEAEGLEALKGFTPELLKVSPDFLLLEWIETGMGSAEDSFLFGERLARLHKKTNDFYGFEFDNFLGRTSQRNTPTKSWLEFFWNERLIFQVELAYKNYKLNSDLKDLIFNLDNRFEEFIGPSVEQPSLIHGDLWSGNYLFDQSGRVYLIDPAVSFSHREVELSMTRLFGGFSRSFYEGYNAEWPLREGNEERVDFYQVYHLLNHLNLFGMSYYNQALNLLRKYI